MKIAIQGHPIRCKEVIRILESLGGKNVEGLTGTYETFYYINDENEINDDHKNNFPLNYRLYTIEEFEKEFPFKIGDEVIFPVKTGWASGKVTGLTYVGDQLKYEVDNRIAGYRYIEPRILQLYPIKEERNITLTLDKAKEWYNKGGELKEIALQAFTEKELNSLPRSWEEFCKQSNPVASWRYNIPIKYETLFKLEQLRDCWIQNWKPDWNDAKQAKYCISYYRGRFKIAILYETRCFLSFPTIKMAEEFLEYFRDLLEKAGNLI